MSEISKANSRLAMSLSNALHFATLNLRFDSMPNNITVKQSIAALPDPLVRPTLFYDSVTTERPWSTRRLPLWEQINFDHVDVIGFQEALVRQVNDLDQLFNLNTANAFDWVGVGREDGKDGGEFNPIFYRTSVYQLSETDTFWLSDPYNTPSIYPRANSKRICTVARLKPTNGVGKPLTFLNTHLDVTSEEARQYGASMILYRARYEEYALGATVIVTGDLNAQPFGSDKAAYEILTGVRPGVFINQTAFIDAYAVNSSAPPFALLDLRGKTAPLNVDGHWATFTGFSEVNNKTDYKRIDYVFAGSNSNVKPEQYLVEENLRDDGVYRSDHRLIVSSVQV